MSEHYPFAGDVTYWLEGDRVAIGLSGASLPRPLRVSTKVNGEVGRALLRDMLLQRIEALEEHGFSVLALNGDPNRLAISDKHGTLFLDLYNGSVEMDYLADDEQLCDAAALVVDIAQRLDLDTSVIYGKNRRMDNALSLLLDDRISYQSRGRFQLEALQFSGHLITIEDTARFVVPVQTKAELQAVEEQVGSFMSVLIDATECQWAHEDLDLNDFTTLVFNDENFIYLRSNVKGTVRARYSEIFGGEKTQVEIYDVHGAKGIDLYLRDRLNAIAQVAEDDRVYYLRTEQVPSFDLDAWLQDLAELTSSPLMLGVVRERIEGLLRERRSSSQEPREAF